jgi:hypothetical protein
MKQSVPIKQRLTTSLISLLREEIDKGSGKTCHDDHIYPIGCRLSKK